MATQTSSNFAQGNRALVLNLFRRRQQPDLFCAVPTDRRIPFFLSDGAWTYVSSLDPEQPRPKGFCPREAQDYCRSDGYYVFYTSDGDSSGVREAS